MSSKLTKSTTSYQSPVTSNHLPATEGDLIERACENCRFSRPVSGLKDPTLICDHKADAEDKWLAVYPAGTCSNFEASRDVLSAEIAGALAEGAKLIPLTQDKFAIVDAQDYEWLCKYKWYALKDKATYYAARSANRKTLRMHREIMRAPKHLLVDHRDHNGLDNRRSNLRLCTPAENIRNQGSARGSTSKYKGVTWCKARNIFQARITFNGRRIHLGSFKNEIDAAKAYDKKAKELFGEFAYLNFPED